MKNIKTAYIH